VIFRWFDDRDVRAFERTEEAGRDGNTGAASTNNDDTMMFCVDRTTAHGFLSLTINSKKRHCSTVTLISVARLKKRAVKFVGR